ncbi:MAG: site-2 protease family protein [Clostridia bacterium]|nr:site-2 protease family protein [Deltaproteobacteria bacterium]
MRFPMNYLQTAVLYLVPLVLSLAVHEFCHAWVAVKLGDDTPARLGRLTLNPIVHMDLMGSLVIPLAFIAMTGRAGFAWAKPVTYNPANFRRGITIRNGNMLVAIAGPASNLGMLVTSALLVKASMHGLPIPEPLMALLSRMMPLNAALFLFNLLPIPPLDGHAVLAAFLPAPLADRWEAFGAQWGTFVMWPMLIFGGRFLGAPIAAILKGVYTLTGLA